MTHFADADGPRGVDWQLERLAAMTAGMDDPRSLANSAALLRYPHAIGDWARPGIMLYGGSPFPQMRSAPELDLQPVMTLQSEIIAVQSLDAGESVGYGCTFTADRPMRIGVVACGYADGYPRHAPTGTPVLVDGQRSRLLGRVSMDKLCVDLTRSAAKSRRWRDGDPVGRAGEGGIASCRPTKWPRRPARSATNCSARWHRAFRSSRFTEHGQGEIDLFLHRMRCERAQVAGAMPRLRAVEHAGGSRGRSRHAGSQRFGATFAPLAGSSKPQDLSVIKPRDEPRLPTGVEEFDRVLGGGLVAGGVVLIGGDPGIGKSTLLLQALARLAETGQPVLYVSGEESAEQVALRAQRLQLPTAGLRLLPEINLEKIIATLQDEKPLVAVIDSIQTLWSDALQSAPGSVAQVRECAAQLTRFAKQTGTCVILVGHVTKEGALAGPRVLEHIVDTVLYFEGDTHSSFRLVRAVKNRFGAVNELGVFAMTDKGLKRRLESVGPVPFATCAGCGRQLRAGDAGRHAAAAGRNPGAGRLPPWAAIRGV